MYFNALFVIGQLSVDSCQLSVVIFPFPPSPFPLSLSSSPSQESRVPNLKISHKLFKNLYKVYFSLLVIINLERTINIYKYIV